MKMFSASARGFYDTDFHTSIPADAVAVTDAAYAALFAAQSNGAEIRARSDGRPHAVVPTLTQAQILASKAAVVQSHMDEAARALRYDDIRTAVTYADEPAIPRFQAEGQAFRAWRSVAWAACYGIMDEVLAGTRPVPSDAELISALPALVLPGQ